ncbi:MAG: PDZ domain-containing protein, partial [Erysipelotrichales bacterium]|nr:PDZ domain-containing protein [Erysipelotrichales bacterium]
MRRFLLFLQVCLLYVVGVSARSVWVSGESAAITLYYDGVYVNGTYVVNENGKRYDPFRDSNILVGDLIVSVNGESVMSIEEFHRELSRDVDDEVMVKVFRNGEVLDKTILIFKGNREVPISGLYLKDKITGIGTITYFDEVTKSFGALGHSLVSDEDMVISRGKLYEIPILSVRKSVRGTIGEKIADTSSFVYLGETRENSVLGIYGSYVDKSEDAVLMDILSKEEISLGSAYMLTVLEGDVVERFEISIDKVDVENSNPGKGIQFSIKDQRLLSRTGGIVQGM